MGIGEEVFWVCEEVAQEEKGVAFDNGSIGRDDFVLVEELVECSSVLAPP